MLKVKRFRFIEEGLAGDAFYERGRQDFAGVAVYLYGLPSFPASNPVTVALVAAGFIAIQPHYFGTYDSEGEFSPTSMVATLEAVGRSVLQGRLIQAKDGTPFEIPRTVSVCVGHSFGCAAALRGFHKLPGVTTLVLLAPAAHYGQGEEDYGVRDVGLDDLEYVRTSHPHTYRLAPASEWAEILMGKDPLPTAPQPSSLRNVWAVIGDEDTYFDLPVAKERMPRLLEAYCGSQTARQLVVLPGCGHPVAELLSNDGGFNLISHVAALAR